MGSGVELWSAQKISAPDVHSLNPNVTMIFCLLTFQKNTLTFLSSSVEKSYWIGVRSLTCSPHIRPELVVYYWTSKLASKPMVVQNSILMIKEHQDWCQH